MTLDKSGCRRIRFCAKFSQAKTWMPLFCRLFEWICEKNFLQKCSPHSPSAKPSMLRSISSSGPTTYVLRSCWTLWNGAGLVEHSLRPTHSLEGLLITLARGPALTFAVRSSGFIYNGTVIKMSPTFRWSFLLNILLIPPWCNTNALFRRIHVKKSTEPYFHLFRKLFETVSTSYLATIQMQVDANL